MASGKEPQGRASEGGGDEGKKPGFKVSDRRSFADSNPATADPGAGSTAASGGVGSGAISDGGAPGSQGASGAPEPAGGPDFTMGEGEPTESEAANALPPVDFHTFILSLGSSALLHLGELDPPDGQKSRPDLRLAKHTIDIIGMLQEKTRGNLSPPEERLIESLLYDLRLRFVEHGKK